MRTLRTVVLLLLLAALAVACGATPTPLPVADLATATATATALPADTPPVLSPPPTFTPTALPPLPTPVQPQTVTPRPSTATPVPIPEPPGIAPPGQVQITIVYDNTAVEPGLAAEWGFAAWIDYGDQQILFDTGPGGPELLGNLDQLGLDPTEIDVVIISHEHGDHTGGLLSLLQTGIRPRLYLPAGFAPSYKRLLSTRAELVEVEGPLEILPGLHSTGELATTILGSGGALTEQALVIETSEGSVVITGCAHPGIVPIVRAAKRVVPGDVALVMGGFHLLDKTGGAIDAAVSTLRDLGVERVSPTHCTGELAIARFAAAYGSDYIEGGAGRTYVVGAPSTGDSPDGLSTDQMATLGSLEQVSAYPLYVMHYYGDYGWPADAHQPAGHEVPAWACSLFAALGDDEARLYGRNFDWKFSPAVVLFTDPPDGFASISVVDIAYFGFDDRQVRNLPSLPLEDLRPLLQAPYWPFDGMNEHGLAVGMAAVPQGHLPEDQDKPIIDSLGIIREVLDHAQDVDEALALFEAYTIDMVGGPDLHYLVADRTGRSLLVEFCRGELVVTPNQDPWHLATNFITASLPAAAQPGCWRYNEIDATLSRNEGRLNPDGALDLLSRVSQDNTQWSVVYDLSTGQVQVTMGRQYESIHSFRLTLADPATVP